MKTDNEVAFFNSENIHPMNMKFFVHIDVMVEYNSPRGVFGQQFDPLVSESFSKFMTKRAKMTVKE